MENAAIALIEKLPVGYIIVFVSVTVPILLATGVWVLSHIRVDKQGRKYWYSQKYEDTKRNRKQDEILREIHESKEQFLETRKDVLQLQICAANLPATAKRLAYREYKKLGHNSWVDEYVVENGLFTREDVMYVNANQGGGK